MNHHGSPSLNPVQVPTPEETKLLRQLARVRVSYSAELAEMAGMKSKYAGSLLTRLRRKGLIAVAGDSRGTPGKRRVYLEITEHGRTALAVIESGQSYQVVRAFKTKDERKWLNHYSKTRPRKKKELISLD